MRPQCLVNHTNGVKDKKVFDFLINFIDNC